MQDVGESLTQERHERGGAAVQADVASAEMTQQPARALIRREPVTCGADRPLCEVARLMAEEHVNSMIVRAENGGLGIVTDGDLRNRVVAEGMSVDAPVGEVVSEQLTTVGADAAGADVMLAMLDNDVRHVGVLSRGASCSGSSAASTWWPPRHARPLRSGARSRRRETSRS